MSAIMERANSFRASLSKMYVYFYTYNIRIFIGIKKVGKMYTLSKIYVQHWNIRRTRSLWIVRQRVATPLRLPGVL